MICFKIRPRWLARCLAYVGGYYWGPCPVCGKNVAGFEFGADLWRTHNTARITCPDTACIEFAKKAGRPTKKEARIGA